MSGVHVLFLDILAGRQAGFRPMTQTWPPPCLPVTLRHQPGKAALSEQASPMSVGQNGNTHGGSVRNGAPAASAAETTVTGAQGPQHCRSREGPCGALGPGRCLQNCACPLWPEGS